jgi:hypothetical protein
MTRSVLSQHWNGTPARAAATSADKRGRIGCRAGVRVSPRTGRGGTDLLRAWCALNMPTLREQDPSPVGSGSSRATRTPPATPWVHPRGRGEQTSTLSLENAVAGPSPRTRGAASKSEAAPAKSGSIPADAGSRPDGSSRRINSRVHPRGRGEQVFKAVQALAKWGPSPRARGAGGAGEEGGQPAGSIPAGAGSSLTDLQVSCAGGPLSTNFTANRNGKIAPVASTSAYGRTTPWAPTPTATTPSPATSPA